jgi:hypothetical protein
MPILATLEAEWQPKEGTYQQKQARAVDISLHSRSVLFPACTYDPTRRALEKL